MEEEQKKWLEGELSKLTILQLRDIARRNNIDIAGSIRKKEIIDKVLAKEINLQGEKLLASMTRPLVEEKRPEAPKVTEKPAQEVARIEEWKAEPERPAKKGEAPKEQKIAEVREYIRYVMANRPSFFPVDGELEAAVSRYVSGDYYGAIQDIQKVRLKASDAYSHFRIFTNALGIDSSEKVLEEAVSRDKISREAMRKLMETAMIGFVDGTPAKREETLDKLESEAIAAFERIIGDVGEDIELRQGKIAKLQEIGANVLDAINLLKEADRLKLALQLDSARELLNRVDALMKRAEKDRVEEIEYSIPKVRSSIDEARMIGLEADAPEKDLKKASYHFERGELKPCVEYLSKAWIGIDKLYTQRLASDPALKQSLLDKANMMIKPLGTTMSEAHSYGVDASEGFHYMSNTQIAIDRQDAVNAIKFSKKAEDLAKQYADDVKILKEKSTHVDGAKCWQCGQDMLYDYVNGLRRCANCGASMKR